LCRRRSGACICPISRGFLLKKGLLFVLMHWSCGNDVTATIIVIAWWVSLWYSRRPHDTLVTFVGEAALWHRGGMSPWLPSWCPRCSSCKALAPFVEINIDCACCDQRRWCHHLSLLVVACRDWLCLVPTLALRSRLGFY
jgi:hypothetical protein